MSFLGGIRRASIALQQCRAYSSKKSKVIIKNEGKQIRNLKIYNPNTPCYQDKVGKAYANYLNKTHGTNYKYNSVYQYNKSEPFYYKDKTGDDEYLTQKAIEHAFKN